MFDKNVVSAKMTLQESPYFPYQLTWKIRSIEYSNVFTTVEQAKDYIIGRYGNITIIDRTKTADVRVDGHHASTKSNGRIERPRNQRYAEKQRNEHEE